MECKGEKTLNNQNVQYLGKLNYVQRGNLEFKQIRGDKYEGER